jgi:hypothetical protein
MSWEQTAVMLMELLRTLRKARVARRMGGGACWPQPLLSVNMKEEQKKRLIELADGSLVERDVLRIVEQIREYDPNLYVQYVDPALADVSDAPYRIIEKCKDGFDRVVFHTWILDGTVLDRLRLADTQRLHVIQEIEKKNAAAKREQIRRYTDKRELEQDIIKHIVDSHKIEYTFPRPKDEAIVRVSQVRPPEVVKESAK